MSRVQIPLSRPVLSSVCNINLVDGLVWIEEVGGSSPLTLTQGVTQSSRELGSDPRSRWSEANHPDQFNASMVFNG